MPSLDLTGVKWNKIDPFMIHMLVDPLKDVEFFEGTTEERIKIAYERGAFDGRTTKFLIRLTEDVIWPETEIPGVVFSSRMGRIIAAQGTIESIIALAKDNLVQSLTADRTMTMEHVSIRHLVGQRS